jgi:hypothetical protein
MTTVKMLFADKTIGLDDIYWTWFEFGLGFV